MDAFELLKDAQAFVAIVQRPPNATTSDLLGWIAANRAELEARLVKHGGILWRGFGLTPAEFAELADAINPHGIENPGGGTPRPSAGRGVFISTVHPAHLPIAQHHERSFARRYPSKIMFYCEHASETGGETPVCSSRQMRAKLDPHVFERFEHLGIRYQIEYAPEHHDFTWQVALDTNDRAVAEAFLEKMNIQYEWRRGGETLVAWHHSAGVTPHPVTAERIFFNQAHIFNEPGYGSEARWGDGTPIASDVLEHIRDTFSREELTFSWGNGDVLLLDNMLSSHGRRPYTGSRRILAALRQPLGADL